MADDPTTLVETAATRVRDPVSGRSIWLAKVVRNHSFDGTTLGVELGFQAEHELRDQPPHLSRTSALTRTSHQVAEPELCESELSSRERVRVAHIRTPGRGFDLRDRRQGQAIIVQLLGVCAAEGVRDPGVETASWQGAESPL